MTSLRRALLLALLAVFVPAGAAHAATYAKDPLTGKLKIKPHTRAKVTAEDLGCRKARFVVLEWKRKADERSGPPKVVSYPLGCRCHFGGTEALLKLNCRKGEKVARARWGG